MKATIVAVWLEVRFQFRRHKTISVVVLRFSFCIHYCPSLHTLLSQFAYIIVPVCIHYCHSLHTLLSQFAYITAPYSRNKRPAVAACVGDICTKLLI